LQVPHKRFKPLCVILDPHLGVGSFTGDFVARHNKTYTLFLFTHSKLRHLRMKSRSKSPICSLNMRRLVCLVGREAGIIQQVD
jgi:hypothetical protein